MIEKISVKNATSHAILVIKMLRYVLVA